jgi:hypothetical protein
MMSHYTYSSVNLTHEDENNGQLSFEIVPPPSGSNKYSHTKAPLCLYEIENSRQILVLTGDSHEELRVIVESFLQANLKIRTKYKCCVLHHCTEENALSCDSYFIVKNIMRQIIQTLPFIGEYLQICDSGTNQFTEVIKEIMSNDSGARGDVMNQHTYPAIFVKFVKRINELKLDFNIVVAITGVEYSFAHDNSNLQSIVYLLRSASVYLHHNSFLKFILTLKKYEEPSKEYRKFNVEVQETSQSQFKSEHLATDQSATSKKTRGAEQKAGSGAFKETLDQDLEYQEKVVRPNHSRY